VHRSKWEHKVSKRRFRNSAALLIAVSLVSAPASATKDLTGKGLTGVTQPSPIFGASLHGEAHSGKTPQGAKIKAAPSSVPEAAGWLMMLAGFGLLGVATRRGTPHPLEQQQLA